MVISSKCSRLLKLFLDSFVPASLLQKHRSANEHTHVGAVGHCRLGPTMKVAGVICAPLGANLTRISSYLDVVSFMRKVAIAKKSGVAPMLVQGARGKA